MSRLMRASYNTESAAEQRTLMIVIKVDLSLLENQRRWRERGRERDGSTYSGGDKRPKTDYPRKKRAQIFHSVRLSPMKECTGCQDFSILTAETRKSKLKYRNGKVLTHENSKQTELTTSAELMVFSKWGAKSGVGVLETL